MRQMREARRALAATRQPRVALQKRACPMAAARQALAQMMVAMSRVSAAICQVVGLVYLTLMFNSLHSLISCNYKQKSGLNCNPFAISSANHENWPLSTAPGPISSIFGGSLYMLVRTRQSSGNRTTSSIFFK